MNERIRGDHNSHNFSGSASESMASENPQSVCEAWVDLGLGVVVDSRWNRDALRLSMESIE